MPVVLATELKKLFIKSDVKGCMTQSFFSALHGLFVCHSSGPQIEGFREQCKISTVSAHSNTKQDPATEMLRQTECSRYVLHYTSLRASALINQDNNTDRRSFVARSAAIFLLRAAVIQMRTAEQGR